MQSFRVQPSRSVPQRPEGLEVPSQNLQSNIKKESSYKAQSPEVKILEQSRTTAPRTTTTPPPINSKTDLDFFYVNSFLIGFRATTISPNAFRCSAQLQNTLNSFNNTLIAMDQNKNHKKQDAAFNLTKIISNQSASAVDECYNTTLGLFEFFEKKRALFNSSNTFMLAFMQTQIGNIITYNNIYQNILLAKSRNQTDQVYQQYGRLFYLMIDVQPFTDSPSPLATSLASTLIAL